ncbi:MAG: CRISPR-associated endonuclease Cas2 [Desulfobulbus sp.]|nr:CRISPR-associated endonuclease Cas2 [Desulfobulbus sp.]
MIAYDIEEDAIRRKVANILHDHGVRVQYSVFECFLDEAQQAALRLQLTALLTPEDSLRWYPLCAWCKEAVSHQGQGNRVCDEGFFLA